MMMKKGSLYLFLISVVSCGTIWILYMKVQNAPMQEPYKSYSDKNESWYQDWYNRLKKGRKIILLYTTWFDHQEWIDYSGPRLYERMEECTKAKNCLLTYDKSWIMEAAAVVFHGRDVEENRNRYYSAKKLQKLRKEVPLAQKWIFWSHENPWKKVSYYRPYDGLFNWTSTFSRKSDIFVPYRDYLPRMNPEKKARNHANQKIGLVAWAASNCRARLRLDYILQLQKYVNITVYGRCNCYFNNKRHCSRDDIGCREEISKHKFYLAFENDFCHDYITEKYWERLRQDSVPIVMGSNYDGLAIPGSYIDTNDFQSIQELAKYLIYLDSNDDEYNKYFAYKAQFAGGNSTLYCRICEKLNSEEVVRHTQVTLSEVYNYEKNCGANTAKRKKLQEHINVSAKKDSVISAAVKDSWCWFQRFFY